METSTINRTSLPPKPKEAFVNEQVTKFFDIPLKDGYSKKQNDNDEHTKSKETIPTSPLFQKTTKVSQKELHSNPHIQKATSPAITVTSWEETNKGEDEFTHGSHIITARRSNSTSTDHSNHISGDHPSKSFRSIMGNKCLPEEDQDLVDPECLT